MAFIVEMLKSRGKLGAAGLMAVGLGQAVYAYFQGPQEYQGAMVTFFLGLSLLGIRSKLG